MNEEERIGFDVKEREEERYVEAPANLRQCTCGEETSSPHCPLRNKGSSGCVHA